MDDRTVVKRLLVTVAALRLRNVINQPWRTQAVCNLTTAYLFDGSLGRPESNRRRDIRHQRAAAICNTCPVRAPCLADAYNRHGRYAEEGVRGGHIPHIQGGSDA